MKKHITHIYPRDRGALAALGRCGYVEKSQLGEWWRDKRLSNFEKDGLIQRAICSCPGSRGDDRTVYRLTAKGRNLCKEVCNLSHLYSPQNPVHDLPLAERYCTLSPIQRETWQTEGDLLERFFQKVEYMRDEGDEIAAQLLVREWDEGKISMPDCAYKVDVVTELAFEVTTNSYGQEEIEAKERAIQVLCIEKYEQERV